MTHRGYIGQVLEVRPILAAMERRGMPIDNEARLALGEEFARAQVELGKELVARAPDACRRLHPKDGYKGVPPEVKAAQATGMFYELDMTFKDSGEDGETYRYEQREFSVPDVDAATGEPVARATTRWCRVYDFNPNSRPQVIAYMKAKGHPIPKDKHRENSDGDSPETTNAKELQRLAVRTGDDFYLKVIEYRGLEKMRGTYVDGFVPAADGCVHTSFTFDTGIGQLSSRNPNCFSADTEVLTKRGWVAFPYLDELDELAQWDARDMIDESGHSLTGRISFARPTSYIVSYPPFGMRHIYTTEQIDMLVTSDHNCLLRDRKKMHIFYVAAEKYPEDAHQLHAGVYEGGNLHYSEEQVALICALQADGHVHKGGGYAFGFSKSRKIERLTLCLEALGIPFTRHKKAGTFYIGHKDIPSWWKDKKHFGAWILELTREALDYMAREVWFWDGCYTRQSMFASASKLDADWVQIITILSNRRAKIRRYRTPLGRADSWQVDASTENYSLTTNRIIDAPEYSGPVYCVSMPLGTVIVRRNGKVALTGNCQNFPKLKPTPALAKAMRRMVAARPGHILTEWDFKSCHIITLGFLAEDLQYMRLGRLDMHSFVAGHFLKLWDGATIVHESDEELRARFKWLKSDPERKRVRDDQAKHGILGIGNGLKAKGLYERYMENFPARDCSKCHRSGRVTGLRGTRKCPACKGTGMQSGQSIADEVLAIAEHLFPKVFLWQKKIQRLAHDQQFLKTEFGHIRWFYEVFRWDPRRGDWGHGDQAEEAIAFWLANIAFGHIREKLKELAAEGLDEKYGLFNNVHDSFVFHFPEELLGEHAREVYPVLVRPSQVLRHPTIAPQGLVIDVEGAWGRCWADMEPIEAPVVAHTVPALQS